MDDTSVFSVQFWVGKDMVRKKGRRGYVSVVGSVGALRHKRDGVVCVRVQARWVRGVCFPESNPFQTEPSPTEGQSGPL